MVATLTMLRYGASSGVQINGLRKCDWLTEKVKYYLVIKKNEILSSQENE